MACSCWRARGEPGCAPSESGVASSAGRGDGGRPAARPRGLRGVPAPHAGAARSLAALSRRRWFICEPLSSLSGLLMPMVCARVCAELWRATIIYCCRRAPGQTLIPAAVQHFSARATPAYTAHVRCYLCYMRIQQGPISASRPAALSTARQAGTGASPRTAICLHFCTGISFHSAALVFSANQSRLASRVVRAGRRAYRAIVEDAVSRAATAAAVLSQGLTALDAARCGGAPYGNGRAQ